jgi:hypothetical protein
VFTRTIELTLKTNVKHDFFKKFKAEVVPILKKTAGFFDLVVLEQDTDVNKLFFVSFWDTKKDAECYEREWYPNVKAIIEPFFATPPIVKYYTLDETFSEKLFANMMV